ncbi:MAG: dihydrofolate reductase family protein [Thermomicrobiales bacterium]
MTGHVFFSMAMSLDGFIAPETVPVTDLFGPEQKPDDPKVQRWLAQWGELHKATFSQRFFRENLKFGTGGEEGLDNDLSLATFERTGASVMGKRMFDAGEMAWPEDAPFHTPVFVVTHEQREPWVRPGGTVFHFVNDGIESALAQAREAAGARDVRVAGGGTTALEYLNAGLVDEFTLTLAPVLFGAGMRLFEGVDADRIALEPLRSLPSPNGVTYLSYVAHAR